MKKISLSILVILHCCVFIYAQDSVGIDKKKIAIFAPLYLDSAFDGANEYRYEKNVFPKFINPGLEFYEGAQLALDSLNKLNEELEVFVYDTRSSNETLEMQLKDAEMNGVNLIIAHCSGNEVKILSDESLRSSVPIINTTIPNDGGAHANPYWVLLNPTLRTHCEGIYKFVQKYYAANTLVVFRKKGSIEDMIKNIFEAYAKTTVGIPLRLRYVDLPENFTVNQVKAQLDSNRKSVCIAGSLDVNFGKKLASTLAGISKSYPLTLIGMPTWDGIKEFSTPAYKGLEIIYSNPFYNDKSDKISQDITNYFATNLYARPSDMVFRGYEVTWKFAKLLLQYGKDLPSNIGSSQYQVFTDYDIQPILNRTTMTLDYFENKKLYFLKWQDGLLKPASQ